MHKPFITFCLLIAASVGCQSATAQQITGAWRGKIDNQRVELKIVQKGDSLTGTAYYAGLVGGRKRYSIKGYFDPQTNSAVWWDDELIEGKGPKEGSTQSVADFNCPGGGRMYLNGKSSTKETPESATGKVDLTKMDRPSIHDEWDFVLDHWT